MKRIFVVACVLVFAAGFSVAADDEIKPLTEEKRAEIIKKWRADYDTDLAGLKTAADKARVLLSNPNTNAEGQLQLGDANEAMAQLKRDPYGLFEKIKSRSKTGMVGQLPHYRTVVVKSDDTGTLADIAYTDPLTTNAVVVRFLLTPQIKGAKAKAAMNQTGIWLLAGRKSIDGTDTLVLQRIEVKPEEVPGKVQPKKK